MKILNKVDTIIIGAGPSGLSAANVLKSMKNQYLFWKKKLKPEVSAIRLPIP